MDAFCYSNFGSRRSPLSQSNYRAAVLAAVLRFRLEDDEQGVWWIYQEDGTQLPATTEQIQGWLALLSAEEAHFQEAVVHFTSEDAEERERPTFALLKGRGAEEGEL